MQVELMNIAKKGLCIVISGLEFTENNKIDLSRFIMKTGNFHNLAPIAECIALNKKIPAIKEVRYQTGWGLKEAKEFVDRYLPMRVNLSEVECKKAAQKFIKDHTFDDFFDEDDFNV